MQESRNSLTRLASIRLVESTTMQLDELAQYYERPLDQAAILAIHYAYLDMLDEKRRKAASVLEYSMYDPEIDDEIPF